MHYRMNKREYNVLIVDDSPINLFVLEEILSSL
jgi:CheY-like chemotaxis protein